MILSIYFQNFKLKTHNILIYFNKNNQTETMYVYQNK